MVALHIVAVWFAANGPIQLYLGLAGFDILTGILQSFKERKVSSEICRDGLIRKAGMVLAVLLGKFLEPHINQPVGAMLATGFCLPEGMSIVENLTGLGVPIPISFTKYFEKLVTK